MVTRWLVMVAMVVMAGPVMIAKSSERRVAEATWQNAEGCIQTTTHVIATLAAIEGDYHYPDGWLRDVIMTVEHNDTCQGVQLANLAGQTTPLADELDITKKLDSATVTTVVAVWDGVTQSGGNLAVSITWDAVTKRRNLDVRAASAVITATGMGLAITSTTEQATISEQ